MPALLIAAAIPATAATAVTIAGTAISYATLIGYAVTIGASVAYSTSQNAKMRNSLKALNDTGRNVMARDPLATQRGIYGEVPVSGPIFFMHTNGTKNDVLHVIMGIAGHECNAMSTIYFDGSNGLETVPLDGAGNATGKYAGKFICKKHLGTNVQAADATLIASAPTYWTAAHRLLGTAYVYLQFIYDANLYPNGMPTVKVLTQGKLLMDPRVGIVLKTGDMIAGNPQIDVGSNATLSVGMRVQGSGIVEGTRVTAIDGSGTSVHVDTNPFLTTTTAKLAFGTVAYSANSILCASDYLSDFKLGRGVPWHRIISDALVAEANICEEVIVLEDTSTEERYNTNGTFTADQDAMPDLLSAMGGRLVDTGGRYGLFAGAYRSPAVGADFNDGDLVGAFQLQPRQSMKDSYSGVRGTYISATNGWQPSDFPKVKNDEYARQDGGRRRWKDVAYPFTISPACAQRLGKADMERGRQQIVFQAVYKLKAFKVACCDTIRITSESEGWINKEFEVITWGLRIIGQGAAMVLAVALTCRETAPGVWDWADGEETVVDLAPNTNLPNPGVVPTPTGLTLLTDATTSFLSGKSFVPRLKASWNTPNNIYIESNGRTFIEYKKSADVAWIEWGDVRGSTLFDYITDVQIGEQYDVRIYHKNEIGVRSNDGAGTLTYQTVTNYTIANDTSVTAVPTGLTASVGTGKLVALTWDANTEKDLTEYIVSRGTSSSVGSITVSWRSRTTRFDDATVTIGTTYWYFVQSTDGTNVSAFSAGVSATPLVIGSSAIDATAPTATTAATQTGSGSYQGSDGTTFAYEQFTIPGLPAGAVGQNILLKIHTDSQYTIIAQATNPGSMTGFRAIGLTPGLQYDLATEAYSFSGIFQSAPTLATGAPFTAPGDSTGPNAPGGFSVIAGDSSGAGITPRTLGSPPVQMYALRVSYSGSSSKDISFYEVQTTAVDTDVAASTICDINGSEYPIDLSSSYFDYWNINNAGPRYMRVRGVDYTGNRGAWGRVGEVSGSLAYPAGNMVQQNKSAIDITGGTIVSITDIALADGGTGASTAASARTNLGVGTLGTQSAASVAITGGSITSLSTLTSLGDIISGTKVEAPLLSFDQLLSSSGATRMEWTKAAGGSELKLGDLSAQHALLRRSTAGSVSVFLFNSSGFIAAQLHVDVATGCGTLVLTDASGTPTISMDGATGDIQAVSLNGVPI